MHGTRMPAEAELRREPPQTDPNVPKTHEERLEFFALDRYDWETPGFDPEYCVLPLRTNRGPYFAIYSACHRERVERFPNPWYLNVQYNKNEHGDVTTIKAVYAFTWVRRAGKIKYYYLHRVVTRARKGTVVDHRNHMGLDCRDSNLVVTSVARNGSNLGQNYRRTYKDLPLGVKVWTLDKSGLPRTFKGRLTITYRGVRREYRSRYAYEDPMRAARWYRLARRFLFKIHHQDTPDGTYLPVVPPEQVPLAAGRTPERVLHEAPFS